jgi:hypothetical protein
MVEGYLGIFILSSVRSSIAGNCSFGLIILVIERNVIYLQNLVVKKLEGLWYNYSSSDTIAA